MNILECQIVFYCIGVQYKLNTESSLPLWKLQLELLRCEAEFPLLPTLIVVSTSGIVDSLDFDPKL